MNLYYQLKILYPEIDIGPTTASNCVINSESGIVYWDGALGPPPTTEQLTSVADEAKKFEENENIRRRRSIEYPPIQEQLDAIWKGGEYLENMRAVIMAVKAKYPKL